MAIPTRNGLIDESYRYAVTVMLPDGKACVVRKGKGRTILLLHGAPLSLLSWRHNINRLAETLEVVALDLKGFGMSQKGRGSYTPEAHARFAIQLLNKLDLDRVSVVGSSYGCAVALALALRHPDRVEKVVLINSVGYPSGTHSLEKLVRIGLLRSFLQPTLRSPALGKRLLASRLRHSYANPDQASPALIDAYFELLCRDDGEQSFLASLEELHEEELANNLHAITHETLIIWGAKDRVLPVKYAHKFKSKIPHARLSILPECGHFPHEEDPETVNLQLMEFVGPSVSGTRSSDCAAVIY